MKNSLLLGSIISPGLIVFLFLQSHYVEWMLNFLQGFLLAHCPVLSWSSVFYLDLLTLIPTAFKMSSFPRGGANSAPPIVTIVKELPYSPNCAWCKAVTLGTCAGYSCLKKIEFVALAVKISSYIIFELRQNLMHFMKKSHRWKVEIIWIFFV